MVEKLKRVTSEADSHKVLDLAYLSACVIGFFQFVECMKAIHLGFDGFSIHLLAVQMFVMCLCGSIAYVSHIKGKVYVEFACIAPIATGLLTVLGGTTIILWGADALNPFAVTMGGLSVSIAVFFVVELIERVYKINKRLRQIRISKTERTEAEHSLTPAYILNKARNVANKER